MQAGSGVGWRDRQLGRVEVLPEAGGGPEPIANLSVLGVTETVGRPMAAHRAHAGNRDRGVSRPGSPVAEQSEVLEGQDRGGEGHRPVLSLLGPGQGQVVGHLGPAGLGGEGVGARPVHVDPTEEHRVRRSTLALHP